MSDVQTHETETERLADWAWTVIANAGGGNWTLETPEWQEAAAKWREAYHADLKNRYPHA